ncbi:MAG TPA: hypothetical protein VFU07_01905 [Candidatus Lumbricidophila sp.]|nr:hypothetical protein [Candidatus Lumbricidophila sp.]
MTDYVTQRTSTSCASKLDSTCEIGDSVTASEGGSADIDAFIRRIAAGAASTQEIEVWLHRHTSELGT